MLKIFKKIKDKIQKIREIRFNRQLKRLFPELPAITWLDKLDRSKYNIKYIMNQKTLDEVKSVVSEETLAAYNVVSVPDYSLPDREVLKVYSPKNSEPEIAYGELMHSTVKELRNER